MKTVLVIVGFVAWLWLYYWLLGVICRAWHFPFWGVFWLLSLAQSGVGMQNMLRRMSERPRY